MTLLKDLLLESKDGEWGQDEADDGLTEMVCIRGTDFELARLGMLDVVPRRFIKDHIAERKRLQSWDILIEAAGGSKDRPTGRTVLLKPGLFEHARLPLVCASFARFLRVDPNKADPSYIFWVLQDWYSNGRIKKYHRQHTGVARFQYTSFACSECFELPHLTTQRRIASVLSAYDDLIENNTKRIKILEEMARALYREWFVCFRFPGCESVESADSSPGSIPERWEVSRLEPLVLRLKNNPVYTEAEVKNAGSVIVVDQSSGECLGFHDEEPTHMASAHDPIIVFGDHTCKMQLMVQPFSTGPNVVAFRARVQRSLVWLFYAAQNLVETREYKRHWSELMAKNVAVPPSALCNAFAATARPFVELMETLKKKNRVLSATRDLLLPRLISGALDVSTLPLPEPT